MQSLLSEISATALTPITRFTGLGRVQRKDPSVRQINFRKEFGTALVTEDDIGQIEDDTVRHMVRLLWVQDRSLRSQIDILRKVRGAPVVQVVGEASGRSVEHFELAYSA